MISDVIKNYKCRLCNSRKLVNVMSFRPTPIGDDYSKKPKLKNKYPLKINKCENCNFYQLSHTINPKILYGDYLYVTKTSLGLPQHFQKLVKKLKSNKILFKGCRVLEIGSNDGTLLKLLKQKGAHVLGVDPAAKKRNVAKTQTINKLFDERLSINIKKKFGKFDLVVANNVVANIDNLNGLFNGIDNVIKNNGYFIMETFSLSGLVKNNLIDNIYHEHISYFSIEPFKKFLQKRNFELFFVEHLNIKGGSLRLIFKKGKISDKFKKQNILAINKERKIFLDKKNTLIKIQTKKELNNKNIINYIKNEKKRGKLICGFGASVGSTTMIYDLKIVKYLSYMFDHEKLRHNLFVPGTNLKVLNPNLIKKIKPDIVIIFAWRYAKNIINKTRFLKSTDLIIPLPKFKIVKKLT